MEVFFFIVLTLMIILGIFVTLGRAEDKEKMRNLLDGSSAIGSISTISSSMPVAEWEDLQGRELYEYFVRKCKSANKSIYEAMLAKQVEHDAKIAEHGALLDQIEEQGSFNPDLMEKKNKTFDSAMKLLDDIHELWSQIDHSLDLETVTSPSDIAIKSKREAFDASETYLAPDGGAGIAIDKTKNKIALLTPYSREIVDFDQIVSSEVCIDSKSIVKSDLGNLVFRAAVGGLLSGGAGAIIGGVTASKTTYENIKSVDLKILVNGNGGSIHNISFYKKGDFGSSVSSVDQAGYWHDLLTIAMEASKSKPKATAIPVHQTQQSLSDQLQALIQMRQSGILTEEEFISAKAKVLAA